MNKRFALATIVVLIDIFIGFTISSVLARTPFAASKLTGVASIISITIVGLVSIALDSPTAKIHQKQLKENKCIYIFYPNGKTTTIFSNGHKAHFFN